jgi:hypothetical protein
VDVGYLLAGTEAAVADLEARWIACGKGRGITEVLFEMVHGATLVVVLLLCPVLALRICEPHCHHVSMEDVPSSCAEHRCSYPGNFWIS